MNSDYARIQRSQIKLITNHITRRRVFAHRRRRCDSLRTGNKSDCSDRKVRREEGERLARDHNVAFLETSAKSGLNVDLAFTAVAR